MRRQTLAAGALALLLGAAVFGVRSGQGAGPEPGPGRPGPAVAPGWVVTVAAKDLEAVDNVAVAPDGTLYATQELPAPRGRVVRIRDGEPKPVLTGLDRPDGLRLAGGRLLVTEEAPVGRVLAVSPGGGGPEVRARLRKPEGIGVLPDGALVVAEDMPDGRVVRIAPDGATTTLFDGLSRPEGLAVGPDGTVYVAETLTGKVLALSGGTRRTVVEGLTEPDQVALAPDGALWITEDADPGRLLRHGAKGLEAVASGLRFPQGIAFGPGGTVYVSEQGAGRILAVRRAGGD